MAGKLVALKIGQNLMKMRFIAIITKSFSLKQRLQTNWGYLERLLKGYSKTMSGKFEVGKNMHLENQQVLSVENNYGRESRN
ncbi:MAG: hypothetical protein E3J86_02890 [Candidatus Thorarchaeota archaeon]|nr:MAG: hypothetical protein E3J86_02890 [Candidatus Thorarchaeota archaeon]